MSVIGPGGGYQEMAEWHCSTQDTPGHMATLGVMAHEMGHGLNLPDLYDLDGSSYGVGDWSLMGLGMWRAVASWIPWFDAGAPGRLLQDI